MANMCTRASARARALGHVPCDPQNARRRKDAVSAVEPGERVRERRARNAPQRLAPCAIRVSAIIEKALPGERIAPGANSPEPTAARRRRTTVAVAVAVLEDPCCLLRLLHTGSKQKTVTREGQEHA